MKFTHLFPDRRLPLIATPENGTAPTPEGLMAWINGSTSELNARINEAGVVLFRGFAVADTETFHRVAGTIQPNLQEYIGGDSPRNKLEDKVYTSTEYPAHLEVLLHNELSYTSGSPDRVFFCCLIAADTGGETHLADGREVYKRMPEPLRTAFQDKGVCYLQHLRDEDGRPGPGKSWQDTYETHDRAEAEARCTATGAEFEWTPLGLRTSTLRPAVRLHEATGAMCWHTQVDQWHRDMVSAKSAVPDAEQVAATGTEGMETVGNHACYGDGTEIAADDLYTIRDVLADCEVAIPWQVGDVMMIDNVLAMHGRKPFTGQRCVVVAMG